MTLILTPEQEQSIREHAEREYPGECCGVFVGHSVGGANYPSLIIPLSNNHEDGTERRFRILSGDLLEVEKLARRKKEAVIGFYHSHPDVPAVPSAYDREHAWELYSYAIVDVDKGVSNTLRSWKLDITAGRFDEENIQINRCVLEEAAERGLNEKIEID